VGSDYYLVRNRKTFGFAANMDYLERCCVYSLFPGIINLIPWLGNPVTSATRKPEFESQMMCRTVCHWRSRL